MLESMRQKGASVAIYLIFGLLILIFVINFAPSNRQGAGGGGCMGAGNTAITVNGVKVNNNAFKIAYSIQDEGKQRERINNALDFLIRREILAQAADDRGLRVDRDAVDEEIKKGWFFYAGQRAKMPVYEIHDDQSKTWSYARFRNWVRNLDVSVGTYQDEQARGLQATLMAELLASSARVSRDEALKSWMFENNTVTYDTVAFTPAAYREAMRLTDADVQRFLAGHDAEVQAKFKADERTYKGVKPQVKVRQIFIGKQDAVAGTPAKAGAKATPAKAAVTVDDAAAKLETARTQIGTDKQKFIDAAKTLSTDEGTKASGGDLGWRRIENAELGDKALNDAVKALKPGEVSPVVKTEGGAYLFMAEETRQGDLTYDQVKMELAAELAKDTWSKEAAKRAALKALEEARAGKGKNLEEMFEREAVPGRGPQQFDFEGGAEGLTPEMIEQIKKQINEAPPAAPAGSGSAAPAGSGSAAGSAQKTGAIEIPLVGVPDVMAGSKFAQANGAGGGSAPAAGSAAPAAGSAAPAAGSAAPAAGSAAPAAPAAGSAAGSAATPTQTTTTTTPAAPAAGAALVPSADVLPAFGEVEKPKVSRKGPYPRAPQLPGVGKDVGMLFDELATGQLAPRVIESEGSFVLVQMQERQTGKVEDFDKVADAEIDRLRQARGRALVNEFVRARCEQLAKDGKIKPSEERVTEFDDKGNRLPVSFRPCSTIQ